MYVLLLIPFFMQIFFIGIDEYYFHRKRGLPLWERIGHPIDTLSVLFCLLFVLFIPYSLLTLKWYIGLCIFSCLMITKDEWVHKHHCPAAEQWLHALLFLNHPIILSSVGLIWYATTSSQVSHWISSCLAHAELLHSILMMQILFVFLFFMYQVIYWNFLWKEKIQSQ